MFVKNAAAVRTVLEASGRVLAAFQGHDHKGSYTLVNGIHYYTLCGMVEGEGLESNAYAVAELDAAGNIMVTGYGRDPGKELSRG